MTCPCQEQMIVHSHTYFVDVGWGVLKVEHLVGTTTGGVLFLLAVDNWSRLDTFARAMGLATSLGLPTPTTAVTCSDLLTPCCL